MKTFGRLLADHRGVTAIEYCLLASLIALALVTSVGQVGTSVAASLADAQASLVDATAGATSNSDSGTERPGKDKPAKVKPPKGKPKK